MVRKFWVAFKALLRMTNHHMKGSAEINNRFKIVAPFSPKKSRQKM